VRLLEPLSDGTAPLARRSPVAKVAAALILALLLLAAVDPVTPAVALAIELAAVPLFGIAYGPLLRRAVPLVLSAVGVGVVALLFTTRRGGALLADLGPLEITSETLAAALGLSVRLLALALPGVIAFATTDPTDLADGLIQHLRMPPRFAIGALAALRLAPLLAIEWETLTLARRARGIDAGANPVARARLFAGTAFALLVGAIRRGSRLATAMDARGFDAAVPRTVARPQRFGAADAALIAGAVAVAGLAFAVSVATDTFRPLF
jgi:energy-coupling factor transport system permease protein